MGTATPSNITISKDSAQVTIATTSVEQIWNKTLTLIPQVKTDAQMDSSQGETAPTTVSLLMKAERRWAVDGHISSDIGTTDTNFSGGSILYANEKRDTLADIFFFGKKFTLTVEGTGYIVNSDKVSIKWESDDQDPIERYSVKFTVVLVQ